MKILVTGGSVHAHIDAVKIVTNTFKGGLMAELAEVLSRDAEVVYLCSKSSVQPPEKDNITIVHHDGFHDYMEKVIKLSPEMDAVVLGAAVANLIPLNPIKGKFPSHDYKAGDVIPINFTIAPRVVDEVKKVAPDTHLFAFKLLAGVPHDELVRAAYEIVLHARATAVFANQMSDLKTKYAITKERGEHKLHKDELARFILSCVADKYYRTENVETGSIPADRLDLFHKLKEEWRGRFHPVPEGYVFGTIAVRAGNGSFITTGRGKKELEDTAVVKNVDHGNLTVFADKKATLNAPLIDWIFKNNPEVSALVHLHEIMPDLPVLPYASPGTVRDSRREISSSFNISGHGCFLLFNEKGDRL